MNLKKPKRDDLITEDGASYILSGSTENTFAGLVVLLGYTNLFARTDQAHDVAWFESPMGRSAQFVKFARTTSEPSC
ncbi:MAG UNVERIFIED_CONTAM: hypothetical protein LVR18_41000 [Planctomycetaceae bacterium]